MHKSKALLLTCIDFRFHKYIQNWLEINHYLGEIDEISVAGGSRDLTKPLENFHKEYLLRQIDLSIKLHNPDEILVIDHQDCGGYAQDLTIPSNLKKEDDLQQHIKYFKIIKELLEKKYSSKTLRLIYVDLEGNFIEIK